jgi:hypothetical protein
MQLNWSVARDLEPIRGSPCGGVEHVREAQKVHLVVLVLKATAVPNPHFSHESDASGL